MQRIRSALEQHMAAHTEAVTAIRLHPDDYDFEFGEEEDPMVLGIEVVSDPRIAQRGMVALEWYS